MRYLPAILLTFIMITSTLAFTTDLSADGDTFEVDDFEYLILEGTDVSIINYSGEYSADFDIPGTVVYDETTYHVKALDFDIYSDIVETVNIQGEVRTVYPYVFSCPNLSDIKINGSIDGTNGYLRSIDGVLYNDSKSKLILYPPNRAEVSYTLDVNTTEVGMNAFSYCLLTTITLNNNLSIINSGAFYGCQNLTEVVIPDDSALTMIGTNAFCDCSNLTTIDLPWSLSYIGAFAFENTGMSQVTIPGGVEFIGDGAFSNCRNLTKFLSNNSTFVADEAGILYHVSNNIRTLIQYPSGKSDLKEFRFPDTVSNIASYAFDGTRYLESVDLGDKLMVVPELAFYNCSSMRSMDLGNVTVIGDMAFCRCTGLTELALPEGLTSIGYSAFCVTNIETLEIPSSVTLIEDEAFSYCEKLKEVTIAESSKLEISACVFFGSMNLEKITINSKDVVLDKYSLEIGLSEDDTAKVELWVPSGYSVPDDVANEYTTVDVNYIGERPYPWVNLIGVFVCAVVIIGILYGMRQV